MSFDLTNKAWAAKGMTPAAKLVLLYAADVAREENGNQLWAARGTIAAVCGLSEATVKAALRDLTDAGHLTRQYRPNQTTLYVVHPHEGAEKLPRGKKLPPSNGNVVEFPGGRELAPGGQNSSGEGAKIYPQTMITNHEENHAAQQTLAARSSTGSRTFDGRLATEVDDFCKRRGNGSRRALARLAGVTEQSLSRYCRVAQPMDKANVQRVRMALAQMQAADRDGGAIDPQELREDCHAWIALRGRGGQAELCRLAGIPDGRLSSFLNSYTDLRPETRRELQRAIMQPIIKGRTYQ